MPSQQGKGNKKRSKTYKKYLSIYLSRIIMSTWGYWDER